jgi:hypothetical protein
VSSKTGQVQFPATAIAAEAHDTFAAAVDVFLARADRARSSSTAYRRVLERLAGEVRARDASDRDPDAWPSDTELGGNCGPTIAPTMADSAKTP